MLIDEGDLTIKKFNRIMFLINLKFNRNTHDYFIKKTVELHIIHAKNA